MKKVDEVYPIDINTTIGPTGTIKRIFRNKDYFAKHGYAMSILASIPVSKNWLTYNYELRELNSLPGEKSCPIMSDTINSPGEKSQLKSKLKFIVENSFITASINVLRKDRCNRRFIKRYLNMKRNPDIVVFHELDSCYHFYKMLGGKAPSLTAMFLHTDGTDDGMFRKSHPKLVGTYMHRRLLFKIEYVYQHTDRIVFISELARQRFCDAHPEYALKTACVMNGIDDMPLLNEAIPSSNFKYRLVSVGSVCKRKGQFIVIEAMRRMSPEVLKYTHYTVIGTGPDLNDLIATVKEYGLQNNVTFSGNKPNSEIHSLLTKENIFVLMSNNEGLPISILEAMRAGLPVISTRIAGIPEEVDERNGLLIYPEIEQLVELLNRLPNYDWVILGKNSRKRFEEEFTFEVMRKKYADLFDGMLR